MATAIERLGILLKLLRRYHVNVHLDELVRLEIRSTPASNVQHEVHSEGERQDDADLVDNGRAHDRAVGIHHEVDPEDANLHEVAMAHVSERLSPASQASQCNPPGCGVRQ